MEFFTPINGSMEEAKQFLREKWTEGANCPCCNQFVKLYKRPFNSGMAYSLILIYKLHLKYPNEWIHLQEKFATEYKLNSNSMDYSQLERWELTERMRGIREDGSSCVGFWRITQKGIRFVLRKTTIPKRVHIYNDKVYGFSGEEIYIEKGLSNKFDYSELMRGY